MAPSGGGPGHGPTGSVLAMGIGHAMRYAMGGAQENHGLLTQNAQQQSMGQGRLHGGCDVRSTGAAWTVYSSWPWGLGVLGFPNTVIPSI